VRLGLTELLPSVATELGQIAVDRRPLERLGILPGATGRSRNRTYSEPRNALRPPSDAAAVSNWTEERIWDAVEAWRWAPPASKRIQGIDYEVFVTPGSYSLTYAYGLSVRDPSRTDEVLRELRSAVVSHGGTGVRVRVIPRSKPSNLNTILMDHGYRLTEETEVLTWELREANGTPRVPDFRPSEGIRVREITSDGDYQNYHLLSASIFGDPRPSEETLRAFGEEFSRRIREQGHSDRFLASDGGTPVGLAGMEIVDRVARMFGSGVLPNCRGRGVYGLLVRCRCEEAARRGATLALVTARVGTSGPILKHHGFRALGTLRQFEARW